MNKLNTHFIRARYDGGGFAESTALQAHSRQEYDAVVLFLVDGFGWHSMNAFRMRLSFNALPNMAGSKTDIAVPVRRARDHDPYGGLPVGF
jgi:hypothetical protein